MHPFAGRASALTATLPRTSDATARSNWVAAVDSRCSGKVFAAVPAVNRTESRPVTSCIVVSWTWMTEPPLLPPPHPATSSDKAHQAPQIERRHRRKPLRRPGASLSVLIILQPRLNQPYVTSLADQELVALIFTGEER